MNKNILLDQNDTSNRCSGESLELYLKVLSQYYDCMGLPELPKPDKRNLTDLLYRLIDNSYMLTRLHQISTEEIRNLKLELNQATKTVVTKEQVNAALKEERADLKKEKEFLKRDIKCLKEECRDYKKEIEKLSKEVEKLKSNKRNMDNHHAHEVRRGEVENRQLTDKLRKNCGKYIGVDHCIAQQNQEYQENEIKMKETIATLQQNNEGLLNEILKRN